MLVCELAMFLSRVGVLLPLVVLAEIVMMADLKRETPRRKPLWPHSNKRSRTSIARGQHWLEAEIHRTRGDILLKKNPAGASR